MARVTATGEVALSIVVVVEVGELVDEVVAGASFADEFDVDSDAHFDSAELDVLGEVCCMFGSWLDGCLVMRDYLVSPMVVVGQWIRDLGENCAMRTPQGCGTACGSRCSV